MHRYPIILGCAATLCLAACGGGKHEQAAGDNAAAGKPAAEAAPSSATAANAPTVSPGLWENTVDIHEMKLEGAPSGVPGLNDAFKPAKTVNRSCLTKEKAAKFGQSDGVPGTPGGAKCDIRTRDWSGGTVRLVMSCAAPNGQGRSDINMTGRYDATSYSLESDTVMKMQQGMTIRSRMTISGKRLGDCKS